MLNFFSFHGNGEAGRLAEETPLSRSSLEFWKEHRRRARVSLPVARDARSAFHPRDPRESQDQGAAVSGGLRILIDFDWICLLA